MNIEMLIDFLFWCTVINYAVLIVWFIGFTAAHDRIYEIHSRWYPMSVEQFNAINYAGAAFYKILVLVFNLVPLVALRIMN